MTSWRSLESAMVTANLKGACKVKSKGRTYWYAWRGGPRLEGKPGSPEFISSYAEAHRSRVQPNEKRISGLVSAYRASSAYTRLAPSTRRAWTPWLDRISQHFGELRVAQFDRPERIRPLIRKWRDQWTDRPRSADYAIQVLSRVLAHAVDLDLISSNPCEGIKMIYSTNRSGKIWTNEDIAAIKAVASPEIGHVIDIAVHTGLRAGDLKRLAWSHISSDAIRIPTSKSSGALEAVVPLYHDLKAALDAIPRRSPVVLTNENGAPWKAVNGSSFLKAKKKALPDSDLHFHDLRGTAATKFYAAGLELADIAEVMGWETGRVEKIIRRYVGAGARTAALIERLNQTKEGT